MAYDENFMVEMVKEFKDGTVKIEQLRDYFPDVLFTGKSDQEIRLENAFIFGHKCTIIGNKSVVIGRSCTVKGNNCLVFGDDCQIYGNNCRIFGKNCRDYTKNNRLMKERIPLQQVAETYSKDYKLPSYSSIVSTPFESSSMEARSRNPDSAQRVTEMSESSTLMERLKPFVNSSMEARSRNHTIMERLDGGSSSMETRTPFLIERLLTESSSSIEARNRTSICIDKIYEMSGIPISSELLQTEDEKKERKERKIRKEGKKKISDLPNLSEIKDEETEDSNLTCVVCTVNKSCIAFQCGHKKTCAGCTVILLKNSKKCPYCRSQITNYFRIFE